MERFEHFEDDPVTSLRLFVLSKALDIAESPTCSLQDSSPGDEACCSLMVFQEGVQPDGAIVQVTMRDSEAMETHLILTEADTAFYGDTDYDSAIHDGPIEPGIAAALLAKLKHHFEG